MSKLDADELQQFMSDLEDLGARIGLVMRQLESLEAAVSDYEQTIVGHQAVSRSVNGCAAAERCRVEDGGRGRQGCDHDEL